jgi:hypothetical protein
MLVKLTVAVGVKIAACGLAGAMDPFAGPKNDLAARTFFAAYSAGGLR